MQLLIYQSAISSVMVVFLIPIFDNVNRNDINSIFYQNFNDIRLLGTILLTGIIALVVNLSMFLLIGKTSAITYHVVGYLKLCLILFSGIIIFKDPITLINTSAIILTLGGVLSYTYFKSQEETRAKISLPTEKSSKDTTRG